MTAKRVLGVLAYTVLLALIANSFIMYNIAWLFKLAWIFVIPCGILSLVAFAAINVFGGVFTINTSSIRIQVCHHGAIMLTVLVPTVFLSVCFHVVLAVLTIPANYLTFILSIVFCAIVESIIFWNGIICIYMSCYRLGIKERVLGIVCAFVPVVNLVMLYRIVHIAFKEVDEELERDRVNIQRAEEKVCATKYPIVMLHGICFRDSKYFNYWGRIPADLKRNGAKIFYGNHHSATPIAYSAQEITTRITNLCKLLDCEKVNIIAHSKGGLDCRYAMDKLGLSQYVASVTTVNSPHRGCLYADYLLNRIPTKTQNRICWTYNFAMRLAGDNRPDLLGALNDLTNESCREFNEQIKDPEGIFCQSFGCVLKKVTGGKFPMNLSYHLVKHFEGPNDGLVSESSFAWGEKYTLLETENEEGISHMDVIDLSRVNLEHFDVREFYVQLVSDLKNRGL